VWLGAALVMCFSIGLAITLIAAGITGAVGMQLIAHRWSGFGERAPYLSGAVMIAVGVYVGWQGWIGVPRPL